MTQFLQRVLATRASRQRIAKILKLLGWTGFGLSLVKLVLTGNYWYGLSMALWPLVMLTASVLVASIQDETSLQ